MTPLGALPTVPSSPPSPATPHDAHPRALGSWRRALGHQFPLRNIATLNADIQSLVTSKEITRTVSVKAAFDSAIAILTFVAVRFLVLFSLFQQLMGKHD